VAFKGLSMAFKHLTVTDKVLSVAFKYLSVAFKTLGKAFMHLSVTFKCLSKPDKVTARAFKHLTAAEKGPSITEKVKYGVMTRNDRNPASLGKIIFGVAAESRKGAGQKN
jgi:hypothetical protein